MRSKRLLQLMFLSMFGLAGLLLLGTTLVRWNVMGPAGLVAGAIPLAVAAIGAFMLQMQIRQMRESGARIRESIDEVAAKLFDEPGAIRPGYDMTVTSGAAGNIMGAFESDIGFTVDGTCRGARVSVASHVSTLGRQMGELSHVYSHVVVDVLGASARFGLTREGTASKIASVAGIVKDARLGDEAFDRTWTVGADEDLARAVLESSIRERLMDLQSKVDLVSYDYGPGSMSVRLTPHGLALRWPGEIDAKLAAYIRDLLLDMRDRMLAYEDRKAAGANAAVGYRVVADAPLEAPIEEAQEEEAAKAARAKS